MKSLLQSYKSPMQTNTEKIFYSSIKLERVGNILRIQFPFYLPSSYSYQIYKFL